jgi:hypothetical protein
MARGKKKKKPLKNNIVACKERLPIIFDDNSLYIVDITPTLDSNVFY